MKWPQNSLFFFICILRNLGDHHNYFSFFLDVFILCCKCLCWCLYLKNFNMHCHLWQPNMLLCQMVTIWRDTRCCLAKKKNTKIPKLGTVSKKGKTLAVFIQSTFVNTNTRFLHFKAVFGQKLLKEAKTVSQQFCCYDTSSFRTLGYRS